MYNRLRLHRAVEQTHSHKDVNNHELEGPW